MSVPEILPAPYAHASDAVLSAMNSTRDGLSARESARRLEVVGFNEIAFKKTPAWKRFLQQFNDPMVIILLATACITAVLTALGSHMLPDTIVIFSVVFLNSVLGFVQEGKVGRIIRAQATIPTYRTQRYYESGAWRATWAGEGVVFW